MEGNDGEVMEWERTGRRETIKGGDGGGMKRWERTKKRDEEGRE